MNQANRTPADTYWYAMGMQNRRADNDVSVVRIFAASQLWLYFLLVSFTSSRVEKCEGGYGLTSVFHLFTEFTTRGAAKSTSSAIMTVK
jgi:hypothetical protein